MSGSFGNFDGYHPLPRCDICGALLGASKTCKYCSEEYQTSLNDYDYPEPFTRRNFTMAHWGKIREIKRHSTSIGKTQHDMNVEIFTYAYRAVYPTKTDRSPYLNICDIPTAPKASSAFTCTPHSNCSICGSYVENSSFCYKCKSRYLNDRSSGSFPTPFTKRIFGPENWKDIQFIKRRGKKLGKTEEEIKQAISDYAQKAVVEMQTNASLHTTVVHSIFCTPDPQPAKRTAPVTQNPPTPVSPPPAASSGKQPSPPIPKKHSKLTLLFWKKYDEITRDFKEALIKSTCADLRQKFSLTRKKIAGILTDFKIF